MKILETHIVYNWNGFPEMLYKADDNTEEGKWFHASCGAFGQRSMELREISEFQRRFMMGDFPEPIIPEHL